MEVTWRSETIEDIPSPPINRDHDLAVIEKRWIQKHGHSALHVNAAGTFPRGNSRRRPFLPHQNKQAVRIHQLSRPLQRRMWTSPLQLPVEDEAEARAHEGAEAAEAEAAQKRHHPFILHPQKRSRRRQRPHLLPLQLHQIRQTRRLTYPSQSSSQGEARRRQIGKVRALWPATARNELSFVRYDMWMER